MGWIKSLKIEIAKPESDLFKVNAYIQFYLPLHIIFIPKQ